MRRLGKWVWQILAATWQAFERVIIKNPKAAGDDAWIRIQAYLKMLGLVLPFALLIFYFFAIFPSRGKIVINEVELAGNLQNRLKNQPINSAVLLHELLSQLRNRRSPQETLLRVVKIINELDFFSDLKTVMWIDETIPYQKGSDFLPTELRDNSELFASVLPFGGQIPWINLELEISSSVSLKTGDLFKWYERSVLGYDFGQLKIYSLGEGMVASVSTDGGKLWRVTEDDIYCFKSGIEICQQNELNQTQQPIQNSMSSVQRLTDLIEVLAQKMTLTGGEPDMDQDWVGSSQMISAMRKLDLSLETLQPSHMKEAQKFGLLALEDKALSKNAKYLTILIVFATHLKSIELKSNQHLKVDLSRLSFENGSSSIQKMTSLLRSRSSENIYERIEDFIYRKDFIKSDDKLKANIARLGWHANIRNQIKNHTRENLPFDLSFNINTNSIVNGSKKIIYPYINTQVLNILSNISHIENKELALFYQINEQVESFFWKLCLQFINSEYAEYQITSPEFTNKYLIKVRNVLENSNLLKFNYDKDIIIDRNIISYKEKSKEISVFSIIHNINIVLQLEINYGLNLRTKFEIGRIAIILNYLANLAINLQDIEKRIEALDWLSSDYYRNQPNALKYIEKNHLFWFNCDKKRRNDVLVSLLEQIENNQTIMSESDKAKILSRKTKDELKTARNRLLIGDFGNPTAQCKY